jgi:hypothetical protein
MEKIYIVLSHTGTIISKSIKLYTRAQYSHVSISFNQDLSHLYSFGRRRIHNPFSGGFVKDGRNQGIYRKYKKTCCTVYEVDVDEQKYESAKKLIAAFEKRENQLKYNYFGIVSILFGIGFNKRDYYFCSQFVAEVLDKAGIIHFDKNYALVKPIDICKSEDQFKLIYQGKLAHYNTETQNGELISPMLIKT